MNIQETKITIKQLLKEYYKIDSESLPKRREKPEWNNENKLGFLLGIIEYGQVSHLVQLYELLSSLQFEPQENQFIDRMFGYYIAPFQTNDHVGRCQTPSEMKYWTDNDIENFDPTDSDHTKLIKALLKRDKYCLFCWSSRPLRGAHIIKDIKMAYEPSSYLSRIGISDIHQVQNGLLLTENYQGEFDSLECYVDAINDKLVFKVVNATNDINNQDWIDEIEIVKYFRRILLKFSNRQAVDANGEMALYFVNENLVMQPNREALEYHKRACLVWRMAGGLEPGHDCCCDDECNDFYVPD